MGEERKEEVVSLNELEEERHFGDRGFRGAIVTDCRGVAVRSQVADSGAPGEVFLFLFFSRHYFPLIAISAPAVGWGFSSLHSSQ